MFIKTVNNTVSSGCLTLSVIWRSTWQWTRSSGSAVSSICDGGTGQRRPCCVWRSVPRSFRNPLVSESIFGVSAGALVGANLRHADLSFTLLNGADLTNPDVIVVRGCLTETDDHVRFPMAENQRGQEGESLCEALECFLRACTQRRRGADSARGSETFA